MTDNWKVQHGDCRDIMRTLPDNSVDAIVSDPPYGLSFMGKAWDHGVPGVEFWTEALRVAKPGAHLVAFGGTRTYHRLAVAIEDAGWDVRDCLSWLYGSGFPKSLAVDKAIDKMDAAEEQMTRRYRFTAWVREMGLTSKQIDEATGTNMGGHYTTAASQPAIMTREHLDALRHLIGEVPEWVERECAIRSVESKNFAEREVVGQKPSSLGGTVAAGERDADYIAKHRALTVDITAPATDAAKRWHGWGTALKPAWEPIILARKPLTGTVAANVTQYGTGAINVDGCRIGTELRPVMIRTETVVAPTAMSGASTGATSSGEMTTQGRWPANVLLDEDAAGLLDEQVGTLTSGGGKRRPTEWKSTNAYGITGGASDYQREPDSGGPSRFFYTAKVSRREREAGLDGMPERVASVGNHEAAGRDADNPANYYGGNRERVKAGLPPSEPRTNHHPTVKPIALMRWLCRLVTPPDGLILDPFNGSGSTGCAAVLEGFRYLGCELEAEYVEIARRRIAYWESQRAEPDLFG